MKIGDILLENGKEYVIVGITNNCIVEKEELESYIARNALVQQEGEWVTIEELINQRCDMYRLTSGAKVYVTK